MDSQRIKVVSSRPDLQRTATLKHLAFQIHVRPRYAHCVTLNSSALSSPWLQASMSGPGRRAAGSPLHEAPAIGREDNAFPAVRSVARTLLRHEPFKTQAAHTRRYAGPFVYDGKQCVSMYSTLPNITTRLQTASYETHKIRGGGHELRRGSQDLPPATGLLTA
jgi:hypothetical protein